MYPGSGGRRRRRRTARARLRWQPAQRPISERSSASNRGRFSDRHSDGSIALPPPSPSPPPPSPRHDSSAGAIARVARRLLTVRGHLCPASGRAEHALVSLLFVGHRRLSSAVLLLRVDCTRTALRCTPLHPAAPRSALPLHLPCPTAARQRCEGHP